MTPRNEACRRRSAAIQRRGPALVLTGTGSIFCAGVDLVKVAEEVLRLRASAEVLAHLRATVAETLKK